MDRREALAKATITRSTATNALLPAGVSRRLLHTIKDTSVFGKAIRMEVVNEPTGAINKITSGARIIRAATENADDGYRAGVTFPTVPYSTKKLRLPWEVTEDALHENLEGQELEESIVAEMTAQFGLDLDDLDVNGDEADEGGESAFIAINNGLLKLASTGSGVHRIDGSAIDSGELSYKHIFAILKAMPNKYRQSGKAKLFMSPARKINWLEGLVKRETNGGDNVLGGGSFFDKPVGQDIIEVPQFPDTRIIYTDPANLIRVVSWQIRKRRVTGDTDWELATRDKRGYIYFLKEDFIVQEYDALVDLHTLDAIV